MQETNNINGRGAAPVSRSADGSRVTADQIRNRIAQARQGQQNTRQSTAPQQASRTADVPVKRNVSEASSVKPAEVQRSTSQQVPAQAQQRQAAPQNPARRPSAPASGTVQRPVQETRSNAVRPVSQTGATVQQRTAQRPQNATARPQPSGAVRQQPSGTRPQSGVPRPQTSAARPQTATRPQAAQRPQTATSRPQNQSQAVRNQSQAVRNQASQVNRQKAVKTETAKPKKLTAGKVVLRILLVFFTIVIFLFATFMVSLKFMSSDRFPTAQRTLITTLLETGQMKFLASWLLPADKIQSIVDSNSMKEFNEEVDDSLINIGGQGSFSVDGKPVDDEEEDLYVVEISGANFYANMIVIKDPSRVSVATIYPWRTEGVTLDRIVKDSGSLGGINGGLYNSYNNSGGAPYGVCVSNGEIQLNDPYSWPGLVLIGLTEDNILQIINIDGMTAQEVEDLIRNKKIRDAVTFQEESSDRNNHFVQLVINGEARELSGMGSGLNPRTAIGQRADGALLLLVTDGRGKNGHLGASASDLINVMLEYGAVNAANLDGGSSSCMYYGDDYLMTSVTFYYSNASWKLPLAFVFK